MTAEQQAHLESQVLHAAFTAEKAVAACRLRIALVGQQLEALGRGLQHHAEEVTPLPEPTSMYDYREGLNALDRTKLTGMCNELRALIQAADAAEKRKAMLTAGPFASRDSGVS
jgi:hypothetical protein